MTGIRDQLQAGLIVTGPICNGNRSKLNLHPAALQDAGRSRKAGSLRGSYRQAEEGSAVLGAPPLGLWAELHLNMN